VGGQSVLLLIKLVICHMHTPLHGRQEPIVWCVLCCFLQAGSGGHNCRRQAAASASAAAARALFIREEELRVFGGAG
jgi:hypothetical protein